MGDETAQKPPPATAPAPPTTAQSLGTDAITMGASLPFIGPIFAAFGKLSAKGKGIAVLVVLLLVVYPLVSLSMALLIISKSPGSVKKGARNFILSSIGVEDEMMEGVNKSNLVIDASIPRQFTLGSNEDAVQRVAAYQQISFEAFLRKQHIDGGPECAVEQNMPDEFDRQDRRPLPEQRRRSLHQEHRADLRPADHRRNARQRPMGQVPERNQVRPEGSAAPAQDQAGRESRPRRKRVSQVQQGHG